MSGLLLACLAAAATAALWVMWQRAIKRVDMDGQGRVLNGIAFVALALGIAAFTQGPGIVGGVIAGASALAGSFFLILGALAPQSRQQSAVAVGAPLPDFTAPDENGKPFSIESLHGRPVLIKFFRGHW